MASEAIIFLEACPQESAWSVCYAQRIWYFS